MVSESERLDDESEIEAGESLGCNILGGEDSSKEESSDDENEILNASELVSPPGTYFGLQSINMHFEDSNLF